MGSVPWSSEWWWNTFRRNTRWRSVRTHKTFTGCDDSFLRQGKEFVVESRIFFYSPKASTMIAGFYLLDDERHRYYATTSQLGRNFSQDFEIIDDSEIVSDIILMDDEGVITDISQMEPETTHMSIFTPSGEYQRLCQRVTQMIREARSIDSVSTLRAVEKRRECEIFMSPKGSLCNLPLGSTADDRTVAILMGDVIPMVQCQCWDCRHG